MKLIVKNLGKNSKGKQRIQDVTFSCETGNVIGLMGNNGSGKSSLLKILAGLCVEDEGKAFVELDNGSIDAVSNHAASCIYLDSGYKHMNGIDVLNYVATVNKASDRSQISSLAKKWEIPPKTKISEYSLGMNVRLNLAMTFMKEPDILILDEVFNGLDPSGQDFCKKVIVEYAKAGHIVLVSSHSLSDLSEISDEIILMENGKVKKRLSDNIQYENLRQYFQSEQGE